MLLLPLSAFAHGSQAFCQEAITWKRMTHPNIVPLLGVTISPRFQLISDYMSGGDLPEYIKQHTRADRLGLVCIHPVAFVLY